MDEKPNNSWALTRIRESLGNHLDVLLFVVLLGLFLLVAAQRLGTVPVPETDEAYTLQVGYEVVNHGQIALPMYRYLGGNIENSWHSYTPVYFVILGAHLKLFGWGLLQGRAFNLFTAALVLLMTFLIGRRLFNGRVAIIAVGLLVSDQTFFERSRLLRNDFAAAAFAMLAFYLYQLAAEKKRAGYYIAAGLAAGAGVMCHTNILYMLGAIGLLMLLGHGWRVIKQRSLYQFTLAALAVMAYEIVYDLIDYKNFVLQNRDDRLHFGILEPMGFWRNLVGEGKRYLKWYAGGDLFPGISRATLYLFILLTLLALAYLLAYSVWRLKRGDGMDKPAVRLFVVTLTAILFHAFITSHKEIYYMAHLLPWFALCAGVMLSDAFDFIQQLPQSPMRYARQAYGVATVVMALGIAGFIVRFALQERQYLRGVRNPELATFAEFKDVLREVVPDDLCPVAIKAPVLWLAFPEHDRCFATIEKRMNHNLDLNGNEYVVMIPTGPHKTRIDAAAELDASYPLIAELNNTRYGNVRVYYTGTNPQYRALPMRQYYFFRRERGHVSREQVEQGRVIWGYDFTALGQSVADLGLLVDDHGRLLSPEPQDEQINFRNIELKPDGVYQLSLDGIATSSRWAMSVVDAETGAALHQELIGRHADAQHVEGLFKGGGSRRVRIVAQRLGTKKSDPLRLLRIAIREIPPA